MTRETQEEKDQRTSRMITLIVAIGLMWHNFGDQAAMHLILYVLAGAAVGSIFVSILQWADKEEKKTKAEA